MGFIFLLTPCLVSLAAAGSSYLPCGRTIGFAVRLPRNVVETSSYLTTFERSASPYVNVVDFNNSCCFFVVVSTRIQFPFFIHILLGFLSRECIFAAKIHLYFRTRVQKYIKSSFFLIFLVFFCF